MESHMNHPFQPVLYKRIIYQHFIWLTTFLKGIYNENSGIFVSQFICQSFMWTALQIVGFFYLYTPRKNTAPVSC